MNEQAYEWALRLAANGFEVFPLFGVYERDGKWIDEATGEEATYESKSGKRPRLRWVQEATTDRAKIEAWWKQWPNANVGVKCGNLVVVDCDSEDAIDNFEAVYDLREEEACETFQVNTPRGRHYWFIGQSRTFKPASDTDVKGSGGYVVGPGSRTYNGLRYMPYCGEPEDVWKLPEWSARHGGDVDHAPGTGEELRISQGNRSNALVKVAGALSRLGLPRHLTKEFVARVNDVCTDTPLTQAELEDTIYRSIDRWELGTAVVDSMMLLDMVKAQFGASDETVDETEAEETFFSFDEDRRQRPEPVWVYEGLLPEHGIGQLFGPSYVGKTYLAIDLALSLCNGLDWMGFTLNRDARFYDPVMLDYYRKDYALYVLGEGSWDFQERLNNWCEAKNGTAERLVTIEEQGLDLSTVAGWSEIGRQMTMDRRMQAVWHRVGLVVIDTQSLLLGDADENSNTSMTAAMRAAKTVSKTLKAPVLFVHHTGHNGDRARGASAVFAAMDLVMSARMRGENRELEVLKVKRGQLPEHASGFTLDGGVARYDGAFRQFAARNDPRIAQCRAFIEEHGQADFAQLKQLVGIGQGGPSQRFRQLLLDSEQFEFTEQGPGRSPLITLRA